MRITVSMSQYRLLSEDLQYHANHPGSRLLSINRERTAKKLESLGLISIVQECVNSTAFCMSYYYYVTPRGEAVVNSVRPCHCGVPARSIMRDNTPLCRKHAKEAYFTQHAQYKTSFTVEVL